MDFMEMWGFMSRKFRSRGAILLWLSLVFIQAAAGQFSSMDDLAVMPHSEEFGNWMVNFSWSDIEEYDSSVSHGESVSGRVAVETDALTLASSSDMTRFLRVSVMMYSRSDPSQINMTSMRSLANSTLVRSKVCGGINLTERSIDGQMGVFAQGRKCPTGEMIYAAVYPVTYHLDRPGGVLKSDALGVILSTYDMDDTERFLDSARIVQIK